MSEPPPPADVAAPWKSARKAYGWWAAAWTVLVVVLVVLVLDVARRSQVSAARARAEDLVRLELRLHAGDAALGGVYARTSDTLRPDPALEHVPGRDLQSTHGETLTLVSPAHRTRSQAPPPSGPGAGDAASRLVALHPRHPAGTPDPWERLALERLTLTERVVAETAQASGEPVLRVLSGVLLQPSCLSCHDGPGARLGEVFGGVSVRVPLVPAGTSGPSPAGAACAGLAGCWILGLILMSSSARVLHRRELESRRAQRQFEESERRFYTLAEEAPVGIVETDATGRCTYVNRRWCAMTGLTPDESRDLGWTRFLHPEDRESVSGSWASLVQGRGEGQRTFRGLRPDGAAIWVQSSAVVLRDEAGKVTGVLAVNTDVTERHLAEQALRESEARFRLVFEEGPLGIMLTDAEGRFIQVNRAFAEMLGYGPDEFRGKHLLEITHPDSLPDCEGLLRDSAASPQSPVRIEQGCVGRDQRAVWGNLTMVLLHGADTQSRWRLGMFEDITARRLDEIRLREQAALLDIAQDAICVQSLAGHIEFFNPAAEKLYGWSRQEVLGAPGNDLLFGRVSRELLEAQAEVLAKGSWSGELMQSARGGRTIHTQSRFSLIRDARGRPKSILVVSTDLTEQKRLEQQFMRAQRMECIGALASGVAHDLNNVFSPVLMVADCLADRPLPPADVKLVELVRTSAERGAGIVRQLLAFSRGQEIDRVELQVEGLLKEMRNLARETFPKNIEFSTRTAPDVWKVIGDVVQIHQVLLNLCVNARDAMPRGGRLTISASNLRADSIFCEMNPEARPGPYVVLEVNDSGEGMPKTVLERIFDPFFTTKAPGKGTGLGLPTVLNIVKAHQGFVEVYSRVGLGTRFRVFLPAVGGAEDASPLARPAPPADSDGEQILVLDDEEAVCASVREVLEKHRYRPVTALDGADALRTFAVDPTLFSAVITDLMMPGMEGPQFIRAVRQIAPDIPIVVISGTDDGRKEAAAEGGQRICFLDKPFTGEALLQALHDSLHPPAAPPSEGPAAETPPSPPAA